MKLTIEFEGTKEELDNIAGAISDGGIEDSLCNALYSPGYFIEFDYSKCFEAHGYDPEQDGEDLKIIVKKIPKE